VYPEKFIRDNVVAPFVPTSVVIVTLPKHYGIRREMKLTGRWRHGRVVGPGRRRSPFPSATLRTLCSKHQLLHVVWNQLVEALDHQPLDLLTPHLFLLLRLCLSMQTGHIDHYNNNIIIIIIIIIYYEIVLEVQKNKTSAIRRAIKYNNTYVRQRPNLIPAITQVKNRSFTISGRNVTSRQHAIRHA